MGWTGLPADAATDWTHIEFIRQFADALNERYMAAYGREKTWRDYLDNPYAANGWLDGWQNSPPASPANGAQYATADAPTGAWAGHPNTLATWHAGDPGYWSFGGYNYGGYELPDGRIIWRTGGQWREGGHWYRVVVASHDVKAAARRPPDDAQLGDTFAILAADPESEWAGHSHTLATKTAGGWDFATPGTYCTIHADNGLLLTYNDEIPRWQGWQVQSASPYNNYHYAQTTWAMFQAHAEQLAGGGKYVNTVDYPDADDIDGTLASIPMMSLNRARAAAGLRAVDEVLTGHGFAPPYSPGYAHVGERFAVMWAPTGDWAGHANQIAECVYDPDGDPAYYYWAFETPSEGHTVQVNATGGTGQWTPPGNSYPMRDIEATLVMQAGRWENYPAGFTRRFPREIAAIGAPGVAGQKARYWSRVADDWWRYLIAAEPPRTDPPAEPNTSDVYLVSAGATGDWEGMGGLRARWNGSYWVYGGEGSDHYQAHRIAGTQTAYMALPRETGFRYPSPSYHNNGSLATWAKVWNYLVDGILVKPPASPTDGFHYAVAFGATGDWEGQDGKVARWDEDPGEWTFLDAPEGTVVRVHPGLQGSSWRMYIGRDHLRTADDWANLSGKLMEHDGTAWQLAADQAARPDLVTTHGRARHGDFIGPWVFNELHAAIGLLKKTRHVCTFGQGPDPDAILRRSWFPGGSLWWEASSWESGWGPYEGSDADGYAWRGSPWGRVTGLHPGMFATMEWFFVPTEPWYEETFHDFGEGWVEDKQNLWRTDWHVPTADPHYSADRFGALDRPTEFPLAGTWGYEASYATWYAVAAWNFEHG